MFIINMLKYSLLDVKNNLRTYNYSLDNQELNY